MRLAAISWKRLLRWGWPILFIVPGLNLIRIVVPKTVPKSAAGSLVAAPYTVTLKETILGRDGTPKIVARVTYAVRSDGSRYRRLIHTEGTSETVLHMASGHRIMIDEGKRLKSTTFFRSVNPARWHRDPRSGCTASLAGEAMTSQPETVLGTETVGGYRAVRVVAEAGSGARLTSWFAADYGCALIQDRMEFADGNTSEHTLIGLIPGEPESALFASPASFKEVSPSEMAGKPAAAGEKCGPRCQEFLRRLDAEYFANRPAGEE